MFCCASQALWRIYPTYHASPAITTQNYYRVESVSLCAAFYCASARLCHSLGSVHHRIMARHASANRAASSPYPDKHASALFTVNAPLGRLRHKPCDSPERFSLCGYKLCCCSSCLTHIIWHIRRFIPHWTCVSACPTAILHPSTATHAARKLLLACRAVDARGCESWFLQLSLASPAACGAYLRWRRAHRLAADRALPVHSQAMSSHIRTSSEPRPCVGLGSLPCR